MAIENRDPGAGTKFVARYKRQTYACEVVATDDGIRYRLEDGREFGSPSAAGSAVMGGTACNGWRFWSLDGTLAEPEPEPVRKAGRGKRTSAIVQQVRRMQSQKGAPEGQVKYFCSACQKPFLLEGEEPPASCPDGHPVEAEDDLAPVS